MSQPRFRTQNEVSAGGLVLSQDNPRLIALISHRNRGGHEDWVIPKGHRERGESLELTAAREVREETGLEVEVLDKIGEISYSFRMKNVRIQKTVHHFLMRQVAGELSAANDPTGEVLRVGWFDLDELDSTLAHDNERSVAAQALEMLR